MPHNHHGSCSCSKCPGSRYRAAERVPNGRSCSKVKPCCKHSCPRFSFLAMGDTAYDSYGYENLNKLIAYINENEQDALFLVHIGDTQADPRTAFRSTAPDQVKYLISLTEYPQPELQVPNRSGTESTILRPGFLAQRNKTFYKLKIPFFITPGDNDWLDTNAKAGTPPAPIIPDNHPLVTLDSFRNAFYKDLDPPSKRPPKWSFSPVVSQPEEFPEYSKYIENKRWMWKDNCGHKLTFLTAHIVGSSDGLINQPQDILDESKQRRAANLAWIKKGFYEAKRTVSAGFAIFIQANMFDFCADSPTLTIQSKSEGDFFPYQEVIDLINNELLNTYSGQLLLMYGDEHFVYLFKPLAVLQQPGDRQVYLDRYNAVQVIGHEDTGRTKVTVDFSDPQLFSINLGVQDTGYSQPLP